ncbi:hypothetical protein [Amycolatopsis sp. PS_44_ISF1]|uniref:hypothetical protein n=1 Tax=Amycolatopsis sp. PS_44_ISF1 TaxID=2974917 RepID=UPI0028DDC07A|nr:hypothetical protein [Amycolatopsis sp. PS_44_ISF1]MDT8910151.1 hypothetical protein [Amycolatopsis sp. PS_44_ISF1]
MRNGTKFVVRAALVAGGLMMLGTGIASAAESVSPDSPASPLDVHAGTPDVGKLMGQLPKATAEFDDPQFDLPLGPQLDATDLPALPLLGDVQHSLPLLGNGQHALPLLGDVQHTMPLLRSTPITPVNGDLPAVPLPLHGNLSTRPDGGGLANLHNSPAASTQPAMPEIPRPAPATPAVPQMPAMSTMPAMTMPAMTTMPAKPVVPAMPQMPVMPQTPDTAMAPERADIPVQSLPLPGAPVLQQLPIGHSTLPIPTLSQPTTADLPLVPQLQRLPLDGGTSPFTGSEVSPQSAAQKLVARLTGLLRK